MNELDAIVENDPAELPEDSGSNNVISYYDSSLLLNYMVTFDPEKMDTNKESEHIESIINTVWDAYKKDKPNKLRLLVDDTVVEYGNFFAPCFFVFFSSYLFLLKH